MYRKLEDLRLLRISWTAIAPLAMTAMIAGCEESTDAKQRASTVSTASVSSIPDPKRIVNHSAGTAETTEMKSLESETAQSKTATTHAKIEAAQLEASRSLHDADQKASAFAVIGPHTKNVVALYQFFEAAGWNAFLDGLTMKSCPDGYEFFCQTRGAFVELYGNTGGDVDSLVELARNMDLREHFYRLAAAADMYQEAQNQPIAGQPSKN